MVFYQETNFWISVVIILGLIFILFLFDMLRTKFKKKEQIEVVKDDHWFSDQEKKEVKTEEIKFDDSETLILDNEIVVTKEQLKYKKFYTEVEPYDYLYSYKYKRKWGILWKRRVKVAHRKRSKVLRKPEKFVKVRFKLLNDRVVEFPVIASLIGFVFHSGKYLFDETAKYETIQGQELIPTYDFNEALNLPIKQRLRPVKELQEYLVEYDKRLKKDVFSDKLRPSLTKDKRMLELLHRYDDMLKSPQMPNFPVDMIKDIFESGDITETENMVNPQTLHRYLKSDFIQQLVKGALTKIVKIIFWIVVIVLLIIVIDLIVGIINTVQISGVFDNINSEVK